MNSRLKDTNLDRLFTVILSLDNLDDAYDFFDDLCTVTELKAMSQRLNVASLLRKKIVYTEIVEKTGASTATVSRVNRSLMYGTNGYERILSKFDEEPQK